LQFKAPKSERGKRTINLGDTLVALLLKVRESYQRLVAGAPDGNEIDLSLVRIPDDWLIWPRTASPMRHDTPTASPNRSRSALRKSSPPRSACTISGYRMEPGCWIRERRCTSSQKGSAMTLEHDVIRWNRHHALALCLSMIFSENRFPLFRIML
jgi:hypothetical protein